MKELDDYLKRIQSVMEADARYKFEAYSFVMAALHHTVNALPASRHLSGRELLEGIRDYALEQYGPMARTVLNYWGVEKTEDFGKIVFALVEVGILRKQAEDKLEDFIGVYDFEDAFDKSYAIDDDT